MGWAIAGAGSAWWRFAPNSSPMILIESPLKWGNCEDLLRLRIGDRCGMVVVPWRSRLAMRNSLARALGAELGAVRRPTWPGPSDPVQCDHAMGGAAVKRPMFDCKSCHSGIDVDPAGKTHVDGAGPAFRWCWICMMEYVRHEFTIYSDPSRINWRFRGDL